EPNELPAQLRRARLPQQLNRNLDHDWQQALQRTSAERRVGLRWEVELGPEQLRFGATSEEGVSVSAEIEGPFDQARQADRALEQMQDVLGQLGNTHYHATDIRISGGPVPFLPGSRLKALRRELVEQLDAARVAATPHGFRKPLAVQTPVYPQSHLSFLFDVCSHKERSFHHRLGVEQFDVAYEVHEDAGEVPVTISKHCLRYSFNLCPKPA